MGSIGQGVCEIRVRNDAGAFRVIYVARFADAIHVLHFFPKKDPENKQTRLESDGRLLSRFETGASKMKTEKFASVWDAIEDTTKLAENMKLRSELMMALKKRITRASMSQAEAAKLFGVTQPRISDLLRGKINLFGLDALVKMATTAGLQVKMRVLQKA